MVVNQSLVLMRLWKLCFLSQRTDNYYQINNPSFGTLVTNNGNKLTFSYIFRNTNNTGFGPVFTIRNTSNLWEIYFAHNNSNQIYYNLGLPWDDEYLTSSGPIADNVWVMITVTYDGSTWKIYENTTLMGSNNTGTFNFAGELTIGKQTSSYQPEGDLASFFIANEVIDISKIADLHTYVQTGYFEPEPEPEPEGPPEPEPEPEPELDIVSALIWGTNGDATGNMLVDKVGNVNIPINGGESITGVDATYGNYVSLSQRTDNYYQINNPSFGTLVTNNGNQLTFSYIFRNTNNTGFGPVFTIRNTSNLWEIYFAHHNSNQIYYNLGLPWDDEYLTSSGPIADNVWVMITVTYDGSTWKIYENTTLMGSNNTGTFNFAGELTIGKQTSGNAVQVEGDLASFFIANEVIDISKIGDLHTYVQTGYFEPEPEPEPEPETPPSDILLTNPGSDFGYMHGGRGKRQYRCKLCCVL